MGVTNANKQIDTARINCDGILKVTLALAASPDIVSNPTDIVLVLDRSGSMDGSPPAAVRFFLLIWGKVAVYRFLTKRARMALSTARIMTPTSAKMASHMLAMPSAPSTRQISLMPMAKTMFW